MQGSGPKPYVLQRKGNTYSCSCMIWRSIEDAEPLRTCKHLVRLRGDKAETCRVGAAGVRRSKEKLAELLKAEAGHRQTRARQDPAAGAACSALPAGLQAEQDPAAGAQAEKGK